MNNPSSARYNLFFAFSHAHPTEKKIRSFAQLEQGWNYMDGETISSCVIEVALQFLRIGQSHWLNQSDAFPAPNGGILLTFYQNADYYEFMINPDLLITYRHERDNEALECLESITTKIAEGKFKEIWENSWSSQDSSIPAIGTEDSTDSRAQHSLAAAAEGYRSLAWIVSRHPANTSADIFGSVMKKGYQGSRRFIGASS